VAAFTTVSLSVGVVFELVRRVAESGLPVAAAFQVLLLRLPSFLVLSFPMATSMATLLAYSRLSSTSELTALRSIGRGHLAHGGARPGGGGHHERPHLCVQRCDRAAGQSRRFDHL
jgi:hypothetical protein